MYDTFSIRYYNEAVKITSLRPIFHGGSHKEHIEDISTTISSSSEESLTMI